MRIQANNPYIGNPANQSKLDRAQKSDQEQQKKTAVSQPVDTNDQYIPSSKNTVAVQNSYGYEKPAGAANNGSKAGTVKPDAAAIEKLKADSEQAYRQLREMVRQLLERQGMTFRDLENPDQTIVVDEQARAEAAAAIADGGAYSAEAVSDRIVDFAKAVSGGDKTKLGTLRAAIDQGFSEAAKAFGGSLPEITGQTRELINQKLDAWANEG